MGDDARASENSDRRARSRGGRRDDDPEKPWYMRRRLWLATVSLVFVSWKRFRHTRSSNRTDISA
jgi:hypothetical protein